MTVAELVAELMTVEDQSLPVVWCCPEEGPTCIGGLSEEELSLLSSEPREGFNPPKIVKKKAVVLTYGQSLEVFYGV